MVGQEFRQILRSITPYFQQSHESDRREVLWHYLGHGAKEALIGGLYLMRYPEDLHRDGGVTIDAVQSGFLLHDIGKFTATTEPGTWRVPRDLVTSSQWGEMKTHIFCSEELLAECEAILGDHFQPVVRKIALEHHEYYDGNGGPDKLMGEQISYFGRLACIIDHFTSLCESRPERRNSRFSVNEALEFMTSEKNVRIFDPSILNKFTLLIQDNLHMTEQGLRWIGEYVDSRRMPQEDPLERFL